MAALFITAPNWKQPQCSTDECKQNVVHSHTMEYYSAINENELSIHTKTWMTAKALCHFQQKPVSEGYILYGSIQKTKQ